MEGGGRRGGWGEGQRGRREVVLIVDRRQSRGWLIVEGGEKREAKTGRSGTGPIRAGTLRVSLPGNETHPNTRGEKTPRGYHPAIQSTPKVIAPLRDAPFNVAIELRPRRPDTCGLLRPWRRAQGKGSMETWMEEWMTRRTFPTLARKWMPAPMKLFRV